MKAFGTALAYAIYVLIALLIIRWLKNNISQKARDNYAKARSWATDKRAEMAANRRPDPPPSALAARAGALGGGLFEGARLAWRAGLPGLRLGWAEGRQSAYDRWQQRRGQAGPEPRHAADDPRGPEPKPANTEPEEPTDLTFCPRCKYDLANNNWPDRHNDPATGKPCDYDWSTDDRWRKCPKCGGLYPPGIDLCGNCDHRVADGPTRFDQPEPAPQPQQPEQAAPTQGGPMPTTTVPAEIRSIADLREAAKAQAMQAQAELEDAEANARREKEGVDRAQVELADAEARTRRAEGDLADAQRVADYAAAVLNNDPHAVSALAAAVEPAQQALKLSQQALVNAQAKLEGADAALKLAHGVRTNAEAKFNAANAALRALQAHGAAEVAIQELGGRASTRTDAYQGAAA